MVAAAWRPTVTAVALVAVLAWSAMRVSAQTMTVDTSSETLRIRVGGFSFLKGDPVARLKDGRSVRVELAAMVLPGPGKSPAATTRRIFAVSYDLWEERFAVATVDGRTQSVSHLAMAAAEAWCIEQLAIPISALSALGGRRDDVPFWVRLEYRIFDSDAGDAAPNSSDSAYTLQALIDLLSRRRKSPSTGPGQGESQYAIEAGPFRTARGSSSPR